ncbi:hypothetical protein DL96DRAFT_1594488 [Flagelloscypha sp. PMI_526]|nr:hypothetical protein DL96DRAFT_1594488 [Flagelloscypha sp. PMI_526]
MLTRPDFDVACKQLVEKYSGTPSSLRDDPMRCWEWHEHPTFSGLGYLSRSIRVEHRPGISPSLDADALMISEDALEPLDDAAIFNDSQAMVATLDVTQFIVHSATFQVPAFYFTVRDTQGSPLTLPQLMNTTLFHSTALEGTEPSANFALNTVSGPFPMLSQGDHPTLGTPCWFLHPCETAPSITELLNGEEMNNPSPLRVLEVWLLFISSAVNLRVESGHRRSA